MDEEIKISEMLEAESIYEEDFIPIIQNGINKKISASKIETGNGIPTGGTTGQVLTKSSNEDNEVTWKDPVETQVINNLNSSSTTSALSANQGRALNNKIALVKEEIVNNHTYSTEETKIGTWIDGKPLYRKTIIYTSGFVIGGEKVFTHGIANLDEVGSYKAKYLRSDGTTQFIPTIHSDMQKWASGIYDFSHTSFALYVGSLNNDFTINKLIITLEYTKTTD